MYKHVMQSSMWKEFKNSYGTSAIEAGGVVYTKHKIPFTQNYYAYCPRINPKDVNFPLLKDSLKENSCIAIHFDVPNIVKGSPEEKESVKILEEKCQISLRDEFAKGNFILDISGSEDDVLEKMHPKQRYNIKYAEKKGVSVKRVETLEEFELFYELYKSTAQRQKYFYRSHSYIQTVWETFKKYNAVEILVAYYEGKALSSWMFFLYEDVIYYPYGGSSEEMRNLQANCLMGWEGIKLGKKMGKKVFDMWGASEDMSKNEDPYYGFSLFKSKYGGDHVVYIDSYDFVVNEPLFKVFTTANSLRWKLLGLLR